MSPQLLSAPCRNVDPLWRAMWHPIERTETMPHSCRTHCPTRSGSPWLFDLLAGLAVLAALYWLAGRAAAPVSTAVGSLVPVVLVAVGVASCVGLAAWAGVVVRNRRALAHYAALEREAREARAEQAEAPADPAALPSPPRELEAAPIRVEAFRVEVERDAA